MVVIVVADVVFVVVVFFVLMVVDVVVVCFYCVFLARHGDNRRGQFKVNKYIVLLLLY